jgi:hypothetical protein
VAELCPRLRCDVIAATLGVEGAGISLGGRPIDASDETTKLREDHQFVLGEGPLVDATTSWRAVEVPDIGDSSSWLRFSEVLSSRSIGGVFAFPLAFDHTRLGALTLYRSATGPLTDGQRDAAGKAAEATALTVAAHLLAGQATHDAQCGLQRVDRLNMAVGIVMHDLDVGPEDASARIRSHAFADGRPVDEVVWALVARELRLR